MNRPLILVSNDDGIHAKGVYELVSLLEEYGDVICVCPDSARSGQSMAITVNTPLRIERYEDFNGAEMYSVSGTPVDCVKLAMHTIVPRRPDLMVSGINHGSNAAINVIYSGTMGAAFEACACGIPAIGFSLTSHHPDADFSSCFPFIRHLVEKTLRNGLPDGLCLNVNFPARTDIREMRLTKGAKGHWTDEYQHYVDPHGKDFFWLTGRFENAEPDNQDTDEWLLSHGIASVVPVLLDRTATETKDLEWTEFNF